jgi:hypothetical protein
LLLIGSKYDIRYTGETPDSRTEMPQASHWGRERVLSHNVTTRENAVKKRIIEEMYV